MLPGWLRGLDPHGCYANLAGELNGKDLIAFGAGYRMAGARGVFAGNMILGYYGAIGADGQ
jgi:hypothetical protein